MLPLYLPRCDDCIAILLGSVDEYSKQSKKEPGTYYLTRGYIGEVDEDIVGGGFSEVREKYDDETWKWIIKEMLKNYKRLAYINTGIMIRRSGAGWPWKKLKSWTLRFEEIKSTGNFFKKIAEGDWDGDFIEVKPGQ